MITFRLSTVACLLSLCIGSYPSAQSAELPPAKHQEAESSPTKAGTTVIVGRWTGSFYGQKTGAYMSDDVFDFGPGSVGGQPEVEYSGIGRFQSNDGKKFSFPVTTIALVDGGLEFKAGQFFIRCKTLDPNTMQCTKTLEDGRGNQGRFKRAPI